MDRDPETLEMRPEIGDEPVRQPLHPTNDSDSSRSSNSSSRTKFILKVVLALAAILLIYTTISTSIHLAQGSIHLAQGSKLLAQSSKLLAQSSILVNASSILVNASSRFLSLYAESSGSEILPSITFHQSVYVRWGEANCPVPGQTPDAEGYAAVNFNSDGTITGGEVLCMQNNLALGENLGESGSVKLMVAPVNLMNLSKENGQQSQTGLLQCAICTIKHPYTVTLFGPEDCSSHGDLVKLYSGYVVGFPGTSSICVDNDSKVMTNTVVDGYSASAGKLTPAEQGNQKSVPCAVCYGKWLQKHES